MNNLSIVLITDTTFTYSDGSTTTTGDAILSGSADNNKLISIDVGSVVTSIANTAFQDCSTLTSLTFASGSQLASIGQNAFWGVSLSGTITLPKSLTTINQGCFIHPGGDFNIKFESGSELKTIPDYAFADGDGENGLRHITLPASLESIGKQAFYNCDLMTSVTFEEGSMTTGAKTIEDNAFEDCNSLSTIYAYQDTMTAMGWSTSGPQSFYGATDDVTVRNLSVTTFTYSSDPGPLTTIDTTLTASSYGVKTNTLTSIYIGNHVTNIGDEAFQFTNYLTSVTFYTDSVLETIGNKAFNQANDLQSIEIPASVKSIGTSAFFRCEELTSVTFEPNSQLATIGTAAFFESPLDGVLTIPASVTSIGESAFQNIVSLDSVLFASGSQLTTINSSAFGACTHLSGTIILPASLQTIGGAVFGDCYALNTVTFEKGSMTTSGNTLSDYVFYGSGLTTINAYQTTIDNLGWNSTNPQTIGFQVSVTVNNLSTTTVFIYNTGLPTTSTNTTLSGFSNNDALTSIVVASSVMIIGNSAFSSCSNLTSVTFSSDSQLKTISSTAFRSSGLSGSITLPASVESIGNNALSYCESLTSVNLNELTLLTTINESAFRASALSGSLTLPTSVTSIGQFAFYGCSNLTSVNLNELTSLSTIGLGAFRDLNLIQFIIIPASVMSIGMQAFYDCSNLTSITFEEGSLTTGDKIIDDTSNNFRAFGECDSLTTVNVYGNTRAAMNWTIGSNQPFYGAPNNVTINLLPIIE